MKNSMKLRKNNFLPLIIGTLYLGLYPEVFLTSLHSSVVNLVEIINPNDFGS